VYLDPAFRCVVLRQVHNDTTRMIAPSYGFDLVPVLRHAWRAWALEIGQDVCVLSVFVIGFVVNPPAVLAVASGLGLWHLSRLAIRSAVVVIPLQAKAMTDRWLWRTRWRSDIDELRQQERLLHLSGMGCGVLAVMPLVVAGISQVSLSEMVRASGLFALLIVLVVVGRCAAHQLCLNHMHRADSLLPHKLTRRQQAVADQQSHPYVIYRRPSTSENKEDLEDLDFDLLESKTSPFIGSGKLVHRWLPPLTIQLLKSGSRPDLPIEEREHLVPPFKAHELVAHLKDAMKPMGNADDPTRLRGFERNDRLYIAEADVPHRPEWLADRPDQGRINEIIDSPHGVVHHFLEIRASVTGEVMTTVFLRVSVKGRALSLDFAACALTRTPAEYQLLNFSTETGVGAVLLSVLRGLLNLPAEVAGMRRLPGASVLLLGAVLARRNRTLVPRRGATIGAQLSIREEKSTPWSQAQLDKITIYDYMKLIEQRLLKATEDFLKSKGVDISTFDKKASSIINMGVLSMGGKIDMKQSAVGHNSQVRFDTREPEGNPGDSLAD